MKKVVEEKMNNLIAAFFSLFCFINLFYQINCNGSNNNECFNMEEFKDQEMKVVDKPMYRHVNLGFNECYVVVGNEPFIIWLDVNVNVEMVAKVIGMSDRTHIEVFGRSDCKHSVSGNDGFRFEPKCLNCPKYQSKYVPFKIWTEGGPVAVGNIIQSGEKIQFYLPQRLYDTYNVAACEEDLFMQPPFVLKDYTYLLPNEGDKYIHLNDDYTEVFVEINDLFPEHFLIIELEDGKTMGNDVIFEFEANGQYPLILGNETIRNGLLLKIEKEFCQHSYRYVGFVRYVLYINEVDKFKVTFNDTKGNSIMMKHWPNETTLLNSGTFNFKTFQILPFSTTTTLAPSTTSLITTTTIIPSTTVTTTTVSSNDYYYGNDTNDDKIEQTTMIPNPNIIKSKSESASEESEGMSLSILIPIIVGSLLGLLILICIIVICILRCYRSYQRKKYHSLHLETRTQAEEAIRKKRSIWKNIIIALIGPDPNPKRNKQRITSPKTLPESTQLRPNSSPTTPPAAGILRSNANTPVAPPPIPSKTQTIPKPSAPPPLAPRSPALRLQRTQSVPKSSQSQTFSTTLRAAKKAKRDPRFPDLIPGTIEFIVAKQQCDYGSFDGDGPKSGPRDESEIAKFINPN